MMSNEETKEIASDKKMLHEFMSNLSGNNYGWRQTLNRSKTSNTKNKDLLNNLTDDDDDLSDLEAIDQLRIDGSVSNNFEDANDIREFNVQYENGSISYDNQEDDDQDNLGPTENISIFAKKDKQSLGYNNSEDLDDIKDFADVLQNDSINFGLQDEDVFSANDALGFETLKNLETNASEEDIRSAFDKLLDNLELPKGSFRSPDNIGTGSPYMFGLDVIKDHKLRFIGTAEGGCMLHIFNGKYWELLDDERLKQLIYDQLSPNVKDNVGKIEPLITNIAYFIKHEIMQAYNLGKKCFSNDDFMEIQNHIVFNNCVVDVESGKTLPHTHKKPYLTMVNCEYIDTDEDTPTYDKLKENATGADKDSMDMFDLLQAYLLMPNRTAKCFFVLATARDSGKSTFGEFLEGYVPVGQALRFDSEQLGSKFSYAGFERAALVSCLEMSMGKLSLAAVKALKNFTGERRIKIEAKFKNQVTSNIRFKVVLATNGGLYLPTGENDPAFYRRAIVIPFVHSIRQEDMDSDLLLKLDDERSYIISKCVRKMSDYMHKNSHITFPESQISKDMKSEWMGECRWNEEFVSNYLKDSSNSIDVIPGKDIFELYNIFFDQLIDGSNIDMPIRCTKKELFKLIECKYPHVYRKRTRGNSLLRKDKVNESCFVGLKWSDTAKELISTLTH